MRKVPQYTTAEKRAITRAMNIIRERQPVMYDAETLTSAADALAMCTLQLTDASKEQFVCMFLDTQHRLIATDVVATGTLGSASVYPREVVGKTLFHNAAAVIFAHNHPSGEPEPSNADIEITKQLRSALSTIDVRVLDHIIVGNSNGSPSVSLAQRGLM